MSALISRVAANLVRVDHLVQRSEALLDLRQAEPDSADIDDQDLVSNVPLLVVPSPLPAASVQELREDLLLRSEVQHLLVEKWDPKVEARSWDVRSSRHLRATCEL